MSEDKPKLLILEDDEGLRRQYRWTLSDYELFLAGTRDEALSIMRLERPPLAMVDLGLPPDPDGATEGLAALEEILSMAPETKVIVATGNEERVHALKAVSLGGGIRLLSKAHRDGYFAAYPRPRPPAVAT